MTIPIVYHKIFLVEVFSSEPYEYDGLEQIEHDITQGDCAGNIECVSDHVLTNPDVIRDHMLRIRIGNDGDFFGALDEEDIHDVNVEDTLD